MENERKEKAAAKTAQYKKKWTPKPERKETKPEYARRMEEKKRLEGKQMMKYNLWIQRRETDGKLIGIWKKLWIECGNTTGVEEEGNQAGYKEWKDSRHGGAMAGRAMPVRH